jgi:hypothetical protein
MPCFYLTESYNELEAVDEMLFEYSVLARQSTHPPGVRRVPAHATDNLMFDGHFN